jgi:hypothetical protein
MPRALRRRSAAGIAATTACAVAIRVVLVRALRCAAPVWRAWAVSAKSVAPPPKPAAAVAIAAARRAPAQGFAAGDWTNRARDPERVATICAAGVRIPAAKAGARRARPSSIAASGTRACRVSAASNPASIRCARSIWTVAPARFVGPAERVAIRAARPAITHRTAALDNVTMGLARKFSRRQIAGVWAAALGLSALTSCGKNDQAGSAGPVCLPRGTPCQDDLSCCSLDCDPIRARCECGRTLGACRIDDDCCDSYACHSGTCTPGCRAVGSSCSTAADCCGGKCNGGTCAPPGCSKEAEACSQNGDCCERLACASATDSSGETVGFCRKGCGLDGAACDGKSLLCCSGFDCFEGSCRKGCAAEGSACVGDNDCCAALGCVGGKCAACGANGVVCKSASECCRGNCVAGACQCGSNWTPCSADGDCCQYLHCASGQCTCSDENVACAADSECCQGLSCQQGKCQPVGCSKTGAACATESQCCSNNCEEQRCCAMDGQPCDASMPCCFGRSCIQGQCGFCLSAGKSCTLDEQCCGKCVNGQCCGEAGEFCDSASPCCGVLKCQSACCQGHGEPCVTASDCCQFYTCTGGQCCRNPGVYEFCDDDADCCPGSVCKTRCCVPQGGTCASGQECCSNDCTAGKCACATAGTTCSSSPDCCAGMLCNSNTCCGASGSACSGAGDCCSGVCKGTKCS